MPFSTAPSRGSRAAPSPSRRPPPSPPRRCRSRPRPSQSIPLVRDTEIEEYLWDQSRPVFKAAGLDPNAITIYIVNDKSVNAFVAGARTCSSSRASCSSSMRRASCSGHRARDRPHRRRPSRPLFGADREETAPFLLTMLVGIAAIAAGAGDAGMGILLGSQSMMMRTALAYSRVQENSADQAAVTFLDRIGKSSSGMLEVFRGFMNQELLTDGMQDPFVRSHPDELGPARGAGGAGRGLEVPRRAGRSGRRAPLWHDRAKLIGYVEQPAAALRRFPPSDRSAEARYAPLGRLYADGELPGRAGRDRFADRRAARQSVLLRDQGPDPVRAGPDGGGRRAAPARRGAEAEGAAAAGEPRRRDHRRRRRRNLDQAAVILRESLRRDPTNGYAWAQLAIVYGRQGKDGEAALATAEQRFNLGDYRRAVEFARRAQASLPAGSRDAARADDIIAIAKAQMPDDEEERGGRRGRLAPDMAPGAHSLHQ